MDVTKILAFNVCDRIRCLGIHTALYYTKMDLYTRTYISWYTLNGVNASVSYNIAVTPCRFILKTCIPQGKRTMFIHRYKDIRRNYWIGGICSGYTSHPTLLPSHTLLEISCQTPLPCFWFRVVPEAMFQPQCSFKRNNNFRQSVGGLSTMSKSDFEPVTSSSARCQGASNLSIERLHCLLASNSFPRGGREGKIYIFHITFLSPRTCLSFRGADIFI